eukprot:7397700-Pyramimonas_sp.AAC.1
MLGSLGVYPEGPFEASWGVLGGCCWLSWGILKRLGCFWGLLIWALLRAFRAISGLSGRPSIKQRA